MIRSVLIAGAVISTLVLGACASTPTQNAAVAASPMPTHQPAPYVRGSAPFTIPSMMAPGYQCLREEYDMRSAPVRVAVSNIPDRTGKISYEAAQGGTIVSQGGTEMVISALAGLGDNLWQIERYDTAIMTAEIEMGKQRLLGSAPGEVQPLMAGQYLPTDYYIAGAITSVNGNIRSGGLQAEINGVGFGNRTYVMDVTVDLRLIRTSDGRTVAVSRGTKQIVGNESRNGAFSFWGDYLIDINFGERNQEALQLGVRTAIEYAVLELMPSAIQSTQPRRCLDYVDSLFVGSAS